MIKEKTKTSKIYRGSALAFAAAFVVAGLPAISFGNASYASAGYDGVITIAEAETEVVVGSQYTIANAKFGTTDITDISVTYLSTGEAVTVESNKFNVTGLGDYKITYSYEDAGKTFTKEMIVTATESEAVVSLTDSSVVLPKIYDIAKAEGKNLNLPVPSVYVDDSDEAKEVKVYTSKSDVQTSDTDYVIVSVKGAKAVAINKDGNNLFITGSALDTAGNYVVKYEYYQKAAGATNGQYIASTSCSFTVKNGYYYSDYALSVSKGTDFTFVTGVETEISAPVVAAEFYKSASDKEDENKTTESLTKDSVNYFSYTTSVKFWDGSWVDTENTVVDGKYTPAKDGKYRINYVVTDFYGKTASLKQDIEVTSADTQAPEVFMYDASNAANYVDGDLTKGISSYVEETHKLKSKTAANNIVIYAIGATDNVSKLDKMTLKRTFKDSSSTTLNITDYNNYNLIFNYSFAELQTGTDLLARSAQAASAVADETTADAWLKNNKYLKVITNYSAYTSLLTGLVTEKSAEGYDLAAIKAKLAENGYAYFDSTFSIRTTDYSVTYSAEDESENTTTSDKYTFTVVSDAIATSTPVVNIATKFKSSYKLSDKEIAFAAPTVTDDNDSNMKMVVSYQFMIGATPSTTITLGEDDEYVIDLTKAPVGATSVVLTATAENDYGVEGTYSKTLTLADVADTVIPTFVEKDLGEIASAHTQYVAFELPDLSFSDDFYATLTGKITVYKLGTDSKSVVSYAGASEEISANPTDRKYTIIGGEFTPMDAGNYEIVYEVVDPANNIVSVYYFFNVSAAVVTPEFSVGSITAINGDNTVTVGEDFEFEVPTLNVNGATVVDSYSDEDAKTAKYFSISCISGPVMPERIDETSFKVSAAGSYKFQYTVWYSLDGSTYTSITSEVITVTASAATISKYYNINFGDNGVYNEIAELNEEILLYSVGGDENIDITKSTVTVELKGASNNIYKEFKLSDFANGSLYGYTYVGNAIKYKLSYNGSYTIKYNIVDANGNSYVPANGKSEYTIKVGDTDKPEISFETGFLEEEYELNDTLTLDLSKITLSDNESTAEQLKGNLTIKLQRTDDDGNLIEIANIGDAENGIYKYDLSNAGEYTLTVTTKDSVGWSKSETKSFTVSTEGKDSESVSTKTIGIILIVLACLILVGVIAYFVISRIKMNKKAKLAPKADKSKK